MRSDIRDRLQAGQLHETLTGRILDQFYKPCERLSVCDLAEEFGTPLSPMRRAMDRLSRDGLVTLSTDRLHCTVTAPPDGAWLDDVMQYRMLIEIWAVRQIATKRPRETLQRMRASIRQQSMANGSLSDEFRSARDADREFHVAIVAGTGNRVSLRAFSQMQPHLHYARLFPPSLFSSAEVIGEHESILEAVERGDADAAEACVRAHIERAHARFDENEVSLLSKLLLSRAE